MLAINQCMFKHLLSSTNELYSMSDVTGKEKLPYMSFTSPEECLVKFRGGKVVFKDSNRCYTLSP